MASMSPRPGASGTTALSRDDIKAAVTEALAESAHAAKRAALLTRATLAVGDLPGEPSLAERMSQLLERA
ncbi:Uncharacterised protein [Mycobacteroides abscessus subsp. abscessus]|nr:Uncharacterised protein [Mycobacteroides abscessus subsp. abscessus]